MALIAKDSGGGGDFEIHPEGMVAARCVKIIDLGTQETTFQGEAKTAHKMMIQWESARKMTSGDFAGKPMLISQRYTVSLAEKANLRKHLESWRGKKFTKAELDGFDLKNVLGKACLINIIHATDKGKTYANIASVNPLPAEMTAPKASGELIYFSMGEGDFDEDIFNKLSKGVQGTIQKSPEYQQIANGKDYAKGEQEAGKSLEDMDDDIPF